MTPFQIRIALGPTHGKQGHHYMLGGLCFVTSLQCGLSQNDDPLIKREETGTSPH